jgi:cytochrome d ubiquinol oxidase subunit II
MEWYLPLIWSAVLGLAVVMYVLLDGFDLGVGVLFPFAADEAEREKMLVSIKPFWDGNETWLVLGGGGLLVAFPRAYAIIMPAFYLPVIAMLLGLIFRGVAIEFRGAAGSKALWNFAFTAGSAVAGFCQGLILGGMIQGVRVANGAFAGGPFDWATPFAFVCGAGVVIGYALLGATWLVMKTDGDTAQRGRGWAKILLLLVLAFMAIVSLWTPLAIPEIVQRWFSLPNILYLWPVPLVTALTALACWLGLQRQNDVLPFLAALALFLLGYLGLVISRFPFLVPPSLTIWDTAAAPESQIFMLIGTLVLLPVIIGYTGMIYWLFRGKVRAGESYH